MSFLAPPELDYILYIFCWYLFIFLATFLFSFVFLSVHSFGIVDLPQCRAYLCSTRPVDSCRWYQGSCVTGTAANIEKRKWTVLRHCIRISLLIHIYAYFIQRMLRVNGANLISLGDLKFFSRQPYQAGVVRCRWRTLAPIDKPAGLPTDSCIYVFYIELAISSTC